MTEAKAPKVGNIPSHLDEYPPITFLSRRNGNYYTFRRGTDGRWSYYDQFNGVVDFNDWLKWEQEEE